MISPDEDPQTRECVVVSQRSVPSGSKQDRFCWLHHKNASEPVLESNWLIKGLLPTEGLGVVYGPSGSGKSFVAFDIALHLASGCSWRDLRTKQSGVVYIASEAGRTGINRVHAWLRHHERVFPKIFRMSPISMDLSGQSSASFISANDLIDEISQQNFEVGLIVIDTLARNFGGGNENAAEEMGAFVNEVQKLIGSFSCLVLVIHHSGKEADRGARGSSALKAAADTEIEVRRSSGQPGTLRITKQRDGIGNHKFGFDLNVVELGQDSDGDPVTSCVAIEADIHERLTKSNTMPRQKDIALEVLQDVIRKIGEHVDGVGPPSHPVIKENIWKEQVELHASNAGKASEAIRKAFGRARGTLMDEGKIKCDGGYAWLISQG